MPIIININNAGSAAGISKCAVYGETVVFLHSALYGCLEGFPMTAFGESIAMCLQNIIIILLMWYYSSSDNNNDNDNNNINTNTDNTAAPDRTFSFSEKIMVIAFLMLYPSLIVIFLPSSWHFLLMATILPILLYAHGSQIVETHQLKHTGAQSIVTIAMNLFGSSTRILTTLQEVGWDFAFLSGYVLSVVTNGIMLLQYCRYRSNTEQFLRELKQENSNNNAYHPLPQREEKVTTTGEIR
jgi:mannose-P-dolichol utilization defect protein 1